jgi:hypothetical protein
MHLNRLFSTKQREHEMVLYYCLLKYKISLLARIKSSVSARSGSISKDKKLACLS